MTSVVALSAQQPATGSAPQNGGTQVRLVGCIERADQLMSAGGNTLATTVDSLDFVLIRAQEASASSRATGTSGTAPAATSAPETSGPTASKSAAALGEMFRLDAATEMLNPHVGHRVEVVGTRNAPAASAGAAAQTKEPSLATAPLVRVQNVTMISETCTNR